jgi:O-antigen/teichoic acid export membrane protein
MKTLFLTIFLFVCLGSFSQINNSNKIVNKSVNLHEQMQTVTFSTAAIGIVLATLNPGNIVIILAVTVVVVTIEVTIYYAKLNKLERQYKRAQKHKF